MSNLILILVGLFIALALVIKITERHGKPVSTEQQGKFSRIIIILIVIMAIAHLIQNVWS